MLGAQTLVVKFVRANMLLRWMVDTFGLERCILLMRHPCAVVASQLQGRSWVAQGRPKVPELFARYPRIAAVVDKLDTPEEMLAAHWAIETLAPLITSRPYPWRLISYEELVLGGPDAFRDLIASVNLRVPAGLDKIVEKPSATTWRWQRQKRKGGVARLEGWRAALSAEQIRRILDTVYALGVDFYSEAVEPDYARLYGGAPVDEGNAVS